MWPLLVALFVTNATKELLRLPRPNAKNALETQYLEEFGFPSTHTAAAIVWACGLQRTLAPEVGAAVSVSISAAYCILVMFSRLYLGVHSLADLGGGVCMGVVGLI